jgi:predicted GNAT family N-acyltransferase
MSSLLEINTSVISNGSYRENLAVADKFSPFNNLYQSQLLQPQLLKDASRLPEIYDLRLNVWEQSGKNEFVNRKLYPHGWYDHLDKEAFHWVVMNGQNKIIASARLNIFHSLQEFPYYPSLKDVSFPSPMPFAFFSRLVVAPAYTQKGLSRQLYNERAHFCAQRGIRWSQVFINNPHIINQFEKSGFKKIAQANISYHPSSEAHPVNVFIKENMNESYFKFGAHF